MKLRPMIGVRGDIQPSDARTGAQVWGKTFEATVGAGNLLATHMAYTLPFLDRAEELSTPDSRLPTPAPVPRCGLSPLLLVLVLGENRVPVILVDLGNRFLALAPAVAGG